jgi:hypothetical protein
MSRAFPRVLATELCRGPPKDFTIYNVLYIDSPSVARGLRYFLSRQASG